MRIKKTIRANYLEIPYIISMGYALIHQIDTNIVPNSIKYGISIFWIIVWLSGLRIKKKHFEIIKWYVFPYIVIGIMSLVFWCTYSYSIIGSGYLGNLGAHLFYFLLRVLIVLATVGLFSNNAFVVLFKALIFSQLYILIHAGITYGFNYLMIYLTKDVITATISVLPWRSPEWYIGQALEVHDTTFAFGIFALCFIFGKWSKKEKILGLLISIIGIYIGLKRIEVFGIALAVVIIGIMKLTKLSYRDFSKLYTPIIVALSYFYVALIKFDPKLFSFLDIHRTQLYRFLGKLITPISLVFGQGFTMVNYYLLDYQNSLLDVSHSDLTRMFIELGGLLFAFWIIYYHYYLPRKVDKTLGDERAGLLIFVCTIYLFTTYCIDNTLELFGVQIAYLMAPFSIFAFEEDKELNGKQ